MSERTGIEWCDATFNAVWGCTRVSPGCDHCYAETLAKRYGFDVWGNGKFREFGDKHWNEPLRWNAAAGKAGKRIKVFCNSMADWLDNQWPGGVRERLCAMVEVTPHLDWLLLSKRIGNAAKLAPERWREKWPDNAWAGASIVNQEEADRDIPKLLAVPAPVHFISAEPLLGPVDLSGWMTNGVRVKPGSGASWIDWVIAGGESGPGARPMHPAWARGLRDQCRAAGVPFFFKQWGEWAPHKPAAGGDLGGDVRAGRVRIVHPTGQTDVEVSEQTGGHNTIPGTCYMARTGKRAAGRLLDGVEHSEFPR